MKAGLRVALTGRRGYFTTFPVSASIVTPRSPLVPVSPQCTRGRNNTTGDPEGPPVGVTVTKSSAAPYPIFAASAMRSAMRQE